MSASVSIIELVNELFNGVEDTGFDVPSAKLSNKGYQGSLTIEYKGMISIGVWGGQFVVSGSDCSRCDGSHVDCEDIEEVTKDYAEVCEMAESMYNRVSR